MRWCSGAELHVRQCTFYQSSVRGKKDAVREVPRLLVAIFKITCSNDD
jgi:hypothetical protein